MIPMAARAEVNLPHWLMTLPSPALSRLDASATGLRSRQTGSRHRAFGARSSTGASSIDATGSPRGTRWPSGRPSPTRSSKAGTCCLAAALDREARSSCSRWRQTASWPACCRCARAQLLRPSHSALANWLHANAFWACRWSRGAGERVLARAARLVRPRGGSRCSCTWRTCRRGPAARRAGRVLAEDGRPAATWSAKSAPCCHGASGRRLSRSRAVSQEAQGTAPPAPPPGRRRRIQLERLTDDTRVAEWTRIPRARSRGWKGEAGSALQSDHGTRAIFRTPSPGPRRAAGSNASRCRLDGKPIAMLASFIDPATPIPSRPPSTRITRAFRPACCCSARTLPARARRYRVGGQLRAPDHPMIDHFWRERRAIERLSSASAAPAPRGLLPR